MAQYNEGDRIFTVIHGVSGTVQRKLAQNHYRVALDQEIMVAESTGLKLKTLNFFDWELEPERTK